MWSRQARDVVSSKEDPHTPPPRRRIQQNNYSSHYTLIDCLDQENDQSPCKELIVNEVPIPEGNLPQCDDEEDPTCITIDGVLTTEECTKIIHQAEEAKFRKALVNIGIGEILDEDYRNSDRCIIDDLDFARVLFGRIKALLPETMHTGNKYWHRTWRCCGLNERMRILRYSEGHFFAPHRDGCYRRNANEKSFLTVMIYLNSNFLGGSTNLTSSSSSTLGTQVVPKCGSVFVFDHNLHHEGAKLVSGVKYAIRTDVMYQVEKDNSVKEERGFP